VHPRFIGKSNDIWAINMRDKLPIDDLWDILLNGFEETSNQGAYEAMIQD
jgi:hypothetical protein